MPRALWPAHQSLRMRPTRLIPPATPWERRQTPADDLKSTDIETAARKPFSSVAPGTAAAARGTTQEGAPAAARPRREYEVVVVLDADMLPRTDLSEVFEALGEEEEGEEPDRGFRFATALNLDTWGCFSSMGKGQGGLMALRPCRAVAAHMRQLLETCPYLRFTKLSAEQDFLDWCARNSAGRGAGHERNPARSRRYFHFERLALPLSYNYMSHMLDPRGRTYGGEEAKARTPGSSGGCTSVHVG